MTGWWQSWARVMQLGWLVAAGLFPAGARAISDPEALPFLIRSWQTDQGLPNNTVRAVTQTRDGYLWLGTDAGLVRFDGVSCRRYGLTEGLGSLQVTVLLEDAAGALWIGTEGGGVSRWADGRMETFTVKNGLAGNSIQALTEGAPGEIWVGTPTGLSRWRDGRFEAPDARVANSFVFDLARCRNGDILAATLYDGLLRFHGGDFTRLDPMTADGVTNYPRCVMVDKDDRIWAGWRERQRRVSCLENGAWRDYTTNEGMPEIVLNRMTQTADGTVWAASLNEGLYYLRDGRFHRLGRPEGLPDNGVLSVHSDGQFLWAGTQSGGLCRIGPKKLFVYHVMDGLSECQLRSLAEPAPDDLWVATYGQGIYHWNGTALTSMLERPFHEHVIVEVLLGATDGSLWWGAAPALYHWQAGQVLFNGSTLFKGNRVWALCERAAGGVWVGTYNGALEQIDRGKITRLSGLPDRPVTALVEGGDGTLWIGLLGGGLGRLRDGRLDFLTQRDGLRSDLIRALHLDAAGTLWVGMDGGGLARLTGTRVDSFTMAQGLAEDTVLQIVDDDLGNLWLGGNRGISRVYKSSLNDVAEGRTTRVHAQVFGRSDGMASEACVGNFGAALKSRAGQLLFCTEKGLVVIDPRHQENSVVPPRVLLEEVRVDGVGVTNTQFHLPWSGRAAADLMIEPGRHQVEFRYTGIDLDSPERVQFEYRLEGAEVPWTPVGGERFARFSALPTGTYHFLVRAGDGGTVWSQPAELGFTIAAHFWQTAGFRAGAGLGLLALVGLGIRRVERGRYRRRLRRLEQERAMERERARIARDLHDELGSSLTYISMSVGDLVRARPAEPEELMVRLKKISGFAVRTSRSLDEIVWAVNPQNDSVRSLVEYLTQLARELFEDSGVHCRFQIAPDLPATPLPPELRHHLFMTVKEAFNNTLKHATAREMWLTAHAEGNELELTMRDNGTGFDPARVAAGRGQDGLANMRTRIESLGGTFELFSTPGRGTTVRIRVRTDGTRTTRPPGGEGAPPPV